MRSWLVSISSCDTCETFPPLLCRLDVVAWAHSSVQPLAPATYLPEQVCDDGVWKRVGPFSELSCKRTCTV